MQVEVGYEAALVEKEVGQGRQGVALADVRQLKRIKTEAVVRLCQHALHLQGKK